MLTRLVEATLGKHVRTGDLTVILPNGSKLSMGDGTGDPIVVRLTDNAAVLSLLLQPELRTGELFTDSRLLVEKGTVFDFLCLVLGQTYPALGPFALGRTHPPETVSVGPEEQSRSVAPQRGPSL